MSAQTTDCRYAPAPGLHCPVLQGRHFGQVGLGSDQRRSTDQSGSAAGHEKIRIKKEKRNERREEKEEVG